MVRFSKVLIQWLLTMNLLKLEATKPTQRLVSEENVRIAVC